jgi:hypothetical protein
MMKRMLVSVLVIATVACGGSSPTTPSANATPNSQPAPAFDLTGTWAGTMMDVAWGTTGTLRATVKQSPVMSPVTKSYHFTGLWSATFPDIGFHDSGTLDGEMRSDGYFGSQFTSTGGACIFTFFDDSNQGQGQLIRAVNDVLTGAYGAVYRPSACVGSRAGIIRLTRQ